jgi:hypothetical protein
LAKNDSDASDFGSSFGELPWNQRPDGDVLAQYKQIATPIGQAVKDFKPLVWTIDAMVPAGSIIAIAGEPKLAKKSLTCLEMCLSVARGTPFLGMPTRQGKAIFANFEDGYARCVRRLKSFGVPDDALDDVDLVASASGWACLYEYVRRFKPRFCVLDPLMKLELLLNCKDENKANELDLAIQSLCTLVREQKGSSSEAATSLVIPHHVTKDKKVMRGSSALEAALDGWIYAYQEYDNAVETNVLAWTNRDGKDAYVKFGIEFGANGVQFALREPMQYGKYIPRKRVKGTNSTASGGSTAARLQMTDDAVKAAIRKVLFDGVVDGLGRDDLRVAVGVSNPRLAKAQEELLDDGLVQKGKRGKLLLSAAGRALAEREKPKSASELLSDDDLNGEDP